MGDTTKMWIHLILLLILVWFGLWAAIKFWVPKPQQAMGDHSLCAGIERDSFWVHTERVTLPAGSYLVATGDTPPMIGCASGTYAFMHPTSRGAYISDCTLDGGKRWFLPRADGMCYSADAPK